jgi:ABC-type nitrate/sulfonate/bicarbonate transport system substrate-binding protein
MAQLRLILFCFALSLCSLVPTSAWASPNPDRIVITYPGRSVASVDLCIAQERRFFRQEDLQGEVLQLQGNIGVTVLLSGDAPAINFVIGGDVPAQLQGLASGVIHLAALSPSTVILARDRFKLRIHGSTLEDLPNAGR